MMFARAASVHILTPRVLPQLEDFRGSSEALRLLTPLRARRALEERSGRRYDSRMSDPARVEALVRAECVATGESSPRPRRGAGGGGGRGASGSVPGDDAAGSSRGKRNRPAGTYAVSRAVQRAATKRPRPGLAPAPAPDPASLYVGAFSQAPSEARAELESLRVAAVHHWRARMMVKLSHLYAEQVWDSMPLPRKFFIKHRGFGPSHGRDDLPSFRRLFLRCALASAERACEIAPFSVECATLRACVLSLLTTVGGAERATESQLARACAACRTAVRLGDARGAAAGHLETVVLHALGGDGDADGDGDGDGDGDDADGVDPEYGRRRGASLRSMAAFAAHALAERRGGWDHETAWARELEWGDGDDAERVGAASEAPLADGVRDVARGLAAVDVANETNEDEDEDEDEGEDAAAVWNMWESRSVLDYSVGFLRGALG